MRVPRTGGITTTEAVAIIVVTVNTMDETVPTGKEIDEVVTAEIMMMEVVDANTITATETGETAVTGVLNEGGINPADISCQGQEH